MAKAQAATAVEPGRPPAAEEVAADAPELPYLLGTWHGLTQYRCRECPFDALEEETIIEHIAAHWVEDAARPGSGLVLVADKNGNLK